MHPTNSLQQAFCDSEQGWAIYNGEIRNGSNSNGSKYGRSVKPGDFVGVMLDTIEVSNFLPVLINSLFVSTNPKSHTVYVHM